MEYEQSTQESSEEVNAHELPKWAKILFRFHALIFLLGTILVSIMFIHSIITNVQILGSVVADSIVSVPGIITVLFSAFAIFILILEIIYGIGVYKFKRWVLPITLILSFGAVLVGFLNIFNQNFSSITELVGSLTRILLMGLVGYVSIKYWNTFEGSARKLLIQIPLVLVLLPLIIFAVLIQIFTDDPKINDSDLLLEKIEVLSVSDNAHYDFLSIEDFSLQQFESYEAALSFAKDLEDSTSLNSDEAIVHLNNTMGLTDSFMEASNKKAYQCPSLVNEYGMDVPICSLNIIRDHAILTAMKAGVEVDTGNPDQSIVTGMSIIRMGSLMSNAEQPDFIEYLVGMALMDIGLDSLERTLENSATNTTNKTLESAANELDGYILDGSSYARSLRREYMSLKESYPSVEQDSSYLYQYNKTVNDLAELYRRQVEVIGASCGSDLANKSEKLKKYVWNEIKEVDTLLLMSPNSIGEILNSVTFSSLNSVGEKKCELNELNQSIQDRLKAKQLVVEIESEEEV